MAYEIYIFYMFFSSPLLKKIKSKNEYYSVNLFRFCRTWRTSSIPIGVGLLPWIPQWVKFLAYSHLSFWSSRAVAMELWSTYLGALNRCVRLLIFLSWIWHSLTSAWWRHSPQWCWSISIMRPGYWDHSGAISMLCVAQCLAVFPFGPCAWSLSIVTMWLWRVSTGHRWPLSFPLWKYSLSGSWQHFGPLCRSSAGAAMCRRGIWLHAALTTWQGNGIRAPISSPTRSSSIMCRCFWSVIPIGLLLPWVEICIDTLSLSLFSCLYVSFLGRCSSWEGHAGASQKDEC